MAVATRMARAAAVLMASHCVLPGAPVLRALAPAELEMFSEAYFDAMRAACTCLGVTGFAWLPHAERS